MAHFFEFATIGISCLFTIQEKWCFDIEQCATIVKKKEDKRGCSSLAWPYIARLVELY